MNVNPMFQKIQKSTLMSIITHLFMSSCNLHNRIEPKLQINASGLFSVSLFKEFSVNSCSILEFNQALSYG